MIEATHLGKISSYPQQYDKSVLVAVPRSINREIYNLKEDNLPFVGIDVWHAYEFSILLESGIPLVGILKIIYPTSSPFLVESKSLKLYLNSFNMERFENDPISSTELAVNRIKTDLSELLQCEVEVTFFNHASISIPNDFQSYSILEDIVPLSKLECRDYTENPELLAENKNRVSPIKSPIKWGSFLLRSNCKITHQPDWGAVFLHMESNSMPSPESFLKYVVSLRNENHFHEEICELIFKRVYEKFSPQNLVVTCAYTRRGGIDINPIRATPGAQLPATISAPWSLSKAIFRQ